MENGGLAGGLHHEARAWSAQRPKPGLWPAHVSYTHGTNSLGESDPRHAIANGPLHGQRRAGTAQL
eukprot:8350772-Pyramimonas_sp.AAC.1